MPDFTNLVTNASLNAKPNEVKDEIPSISNLPTTITLTTVENEIPNITDLVTKANYDEKILEIENKYFTTSYYNTFTSNTQRS